MSKPPPVPEDETGVFVDDTYLGRLAYKETKQPREKTTRHQRPRYLAEEDDSDDS